MLLFGTLLNTSNGCHLLHPVSQFARRTEDETQDVPSDRRSGQQSRHPLRSSQRPACRGGLGPAEKDEVLGVPGVLGEIWPSSLLHFAGKRRNRTRGPITAALAAGAAAGLSGVAAQTVKDANAGLKSALSTRFPRLAVHCRPWRSGQSPSSSSRRWLNGDTIMRPAGSTGRTHVASSQSG